MRMALLLIARRRDVLATPVYKKVFVDLTCNGKFVDFGTWGVALAARNDGVAWRFDIPSASYVDGEGHARAPIQVSGGWMSADTYTADKLGQKLDRIVVAAKSFDSAHPDESVVLMTFGTPNDKQVKAWADVALANAVFETGGRAAGTLTMNADYTKLIYTAPKVNHKGLILLVL